MPLDFEHPYALFKVADMHCAVSGRYLNSFVIVKDPLPVPGSPPYVRGLVNYRGSMIPAIDLRIFFGMKSTLAEADELGKMLEQRKMEHLNWLDALTASIRNGTEFQLTTDPHKCAFGLWYDNYQTEDIGLKQYLFQFRMPHATIHGIAERASHRIANHDTEGAMSLIEQTQERELKEMVRLFDGFRSAFLDSRKEIAIVLARSDFTCGVIVDQVTSMEELKPDGEGGEGSFIANLNQNLEVGRRSKDSQPVLVIDDDALLDAAKIAKKAEA